MGAPFTNHEANHPEAAEHALKSPEHSGPCQLSLKDWQEGAKSAATHGQDSNADAALHSMGLQDFQITHEGAKEAGSAPPSATPREGMNGLARSEGATVPQSFDLPSVAAPTYDTGSEHWVAANPGHGDTTVANKPLPQDEPSPEEIEKQASQPKVAGSETKNDTPPSDDTSRGARGSKPPAAGKGESHETAAAIPSAVTYDADKGRFHVHY